MHKIILFIICILLTSTCFARTDVISNQGTYVESAQTVIGTSSKSLGSTSGIISVHIKPWVNNTQPVYIGNSTVTAKNGIELATATTIILNLQSVDGLYAIAEGADQRVSVLTIR